MIEPATSFLPAGERIVVKSHHLVRKKPQLKTICRLELYSRIHIAMPVPGFRYCVYAAYNFLYDVRQTGNENFLLGDRENLIRYPHPVWQEQKSNNLIFSKINKTRVLEGGDGGVFGRVIGSGSSLKSDEALRISCDIAQRLFIVVLSRRILLFSLICFF